MNSRPHHRFSQSRAFTLIELLAVIAIIGIITAMIVQLAPAVNQHKKRNRVDAEKNKLMALIDQYKAKFGHYPPDNVNLTNPQVGSGVKLPLSPKEYDDLTQLNPLLYELTGGSNFYKEIYFAAFNGTNFKQSEIGGAFGMQGIINADTELQVIYKPFPPASYYQNFPNWLVGQQNIDTQGFLVPVDMVQVSSANTNVPTQLNFWHYDASSTNRHNPYTYDLWAEFVLGKNSSGFMYVTNGNW